MESARASTARAYLKSELWMNVHKANLPTFVDQMSCISVLYVEYIDENVHVDIEKFTIFGRNSFPNVVSTPVHHYIKFPPYMAFGNEHRHDFTLLVKYDPTSGHSSLYVHSALRFGPTRAMSPSGPAQNQDSPSSGTQYSGSASDNEDPPVAPYLRSAEKNHSSVFKVKEENVEMDMLKFSLRDSITYFLSTDLVKEQIQKAIEDKLRTAFEYIEDKSPARGNATRRSNPGAIGRG
jgi:hypothetical protein